MSTPLLPPSPRTRRAGRPLLPVAVALALAVAGCASAGPSPVVVPQPATDAPPSRALALAPTGGAATPAPERFGDYLLRCWQDGRLILEERAVGLPGGQEPDLARLRLLDDTRRPLLLTETRNATCLLRPRRVEPVTVP